MYTSEFSDNEFEDVYGGLGTLVLNEDLEKLKTNNHMLEQHVVSLEEDIDKLTEAVINLKSTQVNLSKNISSLYRTAKTEIDRKDRTIANLHERLANLIFKRKSSDVTANACSKKPKYDESRPYNQEFGYRFERKDNYKYGYDSYHRPRDRSRDRYYNNQQNTGGNLFEGRHEERSTANMRDCYYTKRSRESLDEYGNKQEAPPRSKNSIGISNNCRKMQQGLTENDVIRDNSYMNYKIPKKKLKCVDNLEKQIRSKSITPQNTFEEVCPEKYGLKPSKSNRKNKDYGNKSKDKRTTSIDKFPKGYMDQSISNEMNRMVDLDLKSSNSLTSGESHIANLESNKYESGVAKKVKYSEVGVVEDKSTKYSEKFENNCSKSSRIDLKRSKALTSGESHIADLESNKYESGIVNKAKHSEVGVLKDKPSKYSEKFENNCSKSSRIDLKSSKALTSGESHITDLESNKYESGIVNKAKHSEVGVLEEYSEKFENNCFKSSRMDSSQNGNGREKSRKDNPVIQDIADIPEVDKESNTLSIDGAESKTEDGEIVETYFDANLKVKNSKLSSKELAKNKLKSKLKREKKIPSLTCKALENSNYNFDKSGKEMHSKNVEISDNHAIISTNSCKKPQYITESTKNILSTTYDGNKQEPSCILKTDSKPEISSCESIKNILSTTYDGSKQEPSYILETVSKPEYRLEEISSCESIKNILSTTYENKQEPSYFLKTDSKPEYSSEEMSSVESIKTILSTTYDGNKQESSYILKTDLKLECRSEEMSSVESIKTILSTTYDGNKQEPSCILTTTNSKPEYRTERLSSVEIIKNMSTTYDGNKHESSCILKNNDSNKINITENTNERNNISLLDTVEEKVTKYSDIETILKQTLLNDNLGTKYRKKMLNVVDGKGSIDKKILILSNVITTNNNTVKSVAKEIINDNKIENSTSSLSEIAPKIVEVDKKIQWEIESESLACHLINETNLKEISENDKDETNNSEIISSNPVEIDNNINKKNEICTKTTVSGLMDPSQKVEHIPSLYNNDKISRHEEPLTKYVKIKRNTKTKKEKLDTKGRKKNNQESNKQNIEPKSTAQRPEEFCDNLLSEQLEVESTVKIKNKDNKRRNNYDKQDSSGEHKKLLVEKSESLEKVEDKDTARKERESSDKARNNLLLDCKKSLPDKMENACKSKSLEKVEVEKSAKTGKGSSDNDKRNLSEDYKKSSLEKLEVTLSGNSEHKLTDNYKKPSAEKLEIVSNKSKSLKQIDRITIKTGKTSSGNDKDNKSTGKLEISSCKSKSLEQREGENSAKRKKQFSGHDEHNLSENSKKSASGRKLETANKKPKLLEKIEDENYVEREQESSSNGQNISSDNFKKSSIGKLEAVVIKSQLIEEVMDDNSVKKGIESSSTSENKLCSGKLEIESSKVESPNEMIDHGIVRKRKKSSGKSKHNSDSQEKSSQQLGKNIDPKRRKGQTDDRKRSNDDVKKLPQILIENADKECHELPILNRQQSNDNKEHSIKVIIDKAVENTSVGSTEKSTTVHFDLGALDREENCEFRSKVDNDDSKEKEMIPSGNIKDKSSSKQEVLNTQKEIVSSSNSENNLCSGKLEIEGSQVKSPNEIIDNGSVTNIKKSSGKSKHNSDSKEKSSQQLETNIDSKRRKGQTDDRNRSNDDVEKLPQLETENADKECHELPVLNRQKSSDNKEHLTEVIIDKAVENTLIGSIEKTTVHLEIRSKVDNDDNKEKEMIPSGNIKDKSSGKQEVLNTQKEIVSSSNSENNLCSGKLEIESSQVKSPNEIIDNGSVTNRKKSSGKSKHNSDSKEKSSQQLQSNFDSKRKKGQTDDRKKSNDDVEKLPQLETENAHKECRELPILNRQKSNDNKEHLIEVIIDNAVENSSIESIEKTTVHLEIGALDKEESCEIRSKVDNDDNKEIEMIPSGKIKDISSDKQEVLNTKKLIESSSNSENNLCSGKLEIENNKVKSPNEIIDYGIVTKRKKSCKSKHNSDSKEKSSQKLEENIDSKRRKGQTDDRKRSNEDVEKLPQLETENADKECHEFHMLNRQKLNGSKEPSTEVIVDKVVENTSVGNIKKAKTVHFDIGALDKEENCEIRSKVDNDDNKEKEMISSDKINSDKQEKLDKKEVLDIQRGIESSSHSENNLCSGKVKIVSSKVESTNKIIDHGNVTKRKHSGKSKHNSDSKEKSLKKSENIGSKWRKGQTYDQKRSNNDVEILPQLETENADKKCHKVPISNRQKSNDNIEHPTEVIIDKAVENISIGNIKKTPIVHFEIGALDKEENCEIKSKIDNDDNKEKDMIPSDKIKDISSDKQEVALPSDSTTTPTRRRITPIPVDDTKVCSFTNILEKNQPSTISVPDSPLHLTHEGEIPILHIEENNFNTALNEEEFKIEDNNIMKLLDTIHLSNMDCELSKFKSKSDTLDETAHISTPENRLSFENIMDKITPVSIVSEVGSKKIDASGTIKTVDNKNIAVGNTNTGVRRRMRICRVIVLE